VILISSTVGSTFAPRPTAMLIAARESSQYDGFRIRLSPSASMAAAIALWVMLLDGGAFTAPFTCEGSTDLSIT
jgi:hypothetical protein